MSSKRTGMRPIDMALTALALSQQTEQLRIELLASILETTRTLMELTELELMAGNVLHSRQGMQHIEQGISNVRKLLGEINSQRKQADISRRLAEIEQKASQLAQELEALNTAER